jgi:ribonuclease HI
MVNIFVDGSGSVQGNPIGFAVVVVEDDEIIRTMAWGEKDGTSNIAELKAFIKALEYIKENNIQATIWSDSQYVVKGVQEWLEIWRIKNFQFVKNEELWRKINRLINKDKIKFKIKWIRGHQKDFSIDGVIYNNLADKEAGIARKKIMNNKVK